MQLDLRDKVAIVTGSTRGIGAAIAARLAGFGARVVVNGRTPSEVDAAAKRIGNGSLAIAADVATEQGARDLVEQTIDSLGGVDILVNNAGINIFSPVDDLQLDDWHRVLALNLDATLMCSRLCAPLMRERGGGAIVNMGSLTSLLSFPNRAAYGVSKAGVVMLTRIMAAEWAPTIRVNALAPGYVDTDLIRNQVAQGNLDLDAVMRRIPLKRFAAPDEIADCAAFLASPTASYVTGHTLVIDGGWTAYGSA